MRRTIPIPYYTSTLNLHVDEENLKAVLTAKMHGFHAEKSQEQLVLDALEHPVGSPRLRELAKDKQKIVIVTSDHTRAVPSKITLPLLLKEIRSGNPQADITILIATGLHRPTTEEEQRLMFGDEIVGHEKIAINNAFDPEQFVELCTLPSGAVFQVNKLAAQCDLLVTEGFVEPHFFAGFSGGRKSILPGISGRETIFHNHAFSLDAAQLRSNPAIGNGVLKGNPLHEDMCEAAGLVKNLFIVNLVMNAQMQLAAILSGHYLTSWEAACRMVDRIYQVDVPEKADVIVASCGGFPKDISLYQGTKTIDNIESGLKPGGTLILIIEAREGGGPAEYFDWAKDLVAGTIERRLREHFTVAGYIFFLNCEQAQRYNILLYSSIAPEDVAPMGIKAFSDVNALLDAAQLEGKSIYVIPNGSTVIPHVKEASKHEA